MLRPSLLVAVALLASLAPLGHALPEGFIKETVANVPFVHDLEFIPGSNRVLIVKRIGEILIADASQTPLQPFDQKYLDIARFTSATGEKGLLDVALDPDFATNNYIYTYYCRNTLPGPGTSPANACRISRFTHDPVTETADLASEFVLWVDSDGYPIPETRFPYDHHYGAQLSFGPNGLLYATLGDKAVARLSQDLSTYHGCIVRITKTGLIPEDNVGIAPARGCWVNGLRNGFRSSWDLFTGRFFVAEVGGNVQAISTEDIHVLRANDGGKNLGWPLCEGNCNNPDFPECSCALHDDPIYTYDHDGKGAAVVGGYVYRGSMFPAAEFQGAYFFAEFSRDWIAYLHFDAQGRVVKRTQFDEHDGVIGFQVSPEGALYTMARGDVIRYRYIDPSANQPPALSNFRTSVQGRTATISITATDPERSALSYAWTFGDGTTAMTTGGSTTHTYPRFGTYLVFVSVADTQGAVAFSAPIQLQVGDSPTATSTLSSPQFQAGDDLVFSGSAKDARGKALTGASLVWNILLKHNDHTHPYATGIIGSQATIRITSGGHSWSDDTGLIFELTATDEFGLSATTSKLATPRKVDLTIQRDPCDGAVAVVDGLTVTSECGAPAVLDTLIGFKHELETPAQLCRDGAAWQFAGWSATAGPAGLVQTGSSATYTVPGTATTLTARYERDPQADCFGDRFLKYGNTLRANLDAAGATPILVAGGLVQSWKDTAGGMSLEAPTSAGSMRPAVMEDLRALAGDAQSFVRFDGINDVLEAAGSALLPINAQARTVYLVARFREPGVGGVSYGNPAAASPCRSVFNLGVAPSGALSLGTGCGISTTAGGTVGRGWNVLAATVGPSSIELWVNGVQVGQAAKPAQQTASGPFRIGAWGAPLEHAAVDVAHILVYQGRHTPDRVAEATAYLAAKHLAGPEYLGCFPDSRDRVFKIGPLCSPTRTLSLDECVAMCRSRGMAVAGLQNSWECFCGTAAQVPALVPQEDRCDLACEGETDRMCGGRGFMSFYRLLTPLERRVEDTDMDVPGPPGGLAAGYIGCFVDQPDRLLSIGPLRSPTLSLTPEECLSTCRSMGMAFAGLQFARECWCGAEEEAPTGSPDDVGCTTPCEGDADRTCGGTWRASIYRTRPVPADGYLGCFADAKDARLLSIGPLFSPTESLTPQECRARCLSMGMTFAGLQVGRQCWCGTAGDVLTSSPFEAGCTSPCQGDASRTCGGNFRAEIYRLPPIPPTGLRLGCFVDQRDSRILGLRLSASGTLTPEECVARCLSGGMAFAGLQFAQECWCGMEEEAPTGSPDTAGCTSPCQGDASRTCGASFRAEIYRLPPIPPTGLRLGCFVDQRDSRILSIGPLRSPTLGLTPEECLSTCRSMGMAFAGLQFARECWCGAEEDNPTGSPDAAGCTSPCEGDADRTCGGHFHSEVYRVPRVPADGYLGCYKDSRDRIMNIGPLRSRTSSMAPEECIATCRSMEMEFAGLQFAWECFCGTAAEVPTSNVNEANCNLPCEGDASKTCGASFHSSVYSVPLAMGETPFARLAGSGDHQDARASPVLLGSVFAVVALVAMAAVVALRRGPQDAGRNWNVGSVDGWTGSEGTVTADV